MEDRKEVPRTLQKYLNDSRGFVSALGDSDEIQKFCWFIKHGVIVTTDHPDAFIKIGHNILIIEHFEIDGYEEKKHVGSLATYNEKAIHARFTKQEAVNGSKHLTARLGVKNSYRQFLDNCYQRFEHHYQQIEDYKNHLRKEHIADDDSQYTICFLMDEVSPLGTLTADDDGQINPVCLGYSKEFLDFFDNKPDVDWIISAIIKPDEDSYGWKYHPYFFSRNDIAECRDKVVDYARFQFLESDPCITEVELEIKKQFARVGDILHMEKGKIPSATAIAPKEGYLPYVDIKAFEKGIVDRYASVQNAVLCNNGDLLIVCDGSRSGLTGKAIKGVVGSTLSKVYADGLTTDYLRYYLQSKYELLNTRKKGTGTPHLNADLIKETSIYVPSVDEQNHIVSRIEELFSELDAGVETLQKIKQQLAVYRQAVRKEAFANNSLVKTVEVNEIADDIRIGPFGTLLHKSDYISGGVPIINPQHIKGGKVAPDYTTTISSEKAKQLYGYELKTNDIIMGRRGEMGRTAAITETENGWICGTGSLVIRLKQGFDAHFYAHILSSPEVVHYLEEHATGTTMKNLNEDIVRHIPVPFVTIEIQKMINASMDRKMTICGSIEKTVDEAMQKAAAMRQSILKHAFEGGLQE